jgi:hypothetical protein
MGYYKNDSEQALRVDDGTGRLRRVPVGSVVSVDGDFEKNLKDLDGVSKSSKKDYEAQQDSLNPESKDIARHEVISGQRTDIALQTVAVPLNEVVGDDDAPYGPPSGTITTKQAAARQSPEDRRAFADNEALPEDAKGKKSAVHRKQAARRAKVEELTEAAQESEGSALATPVEDAQPSEEPQEAPKP